MNQNVDNFKIQTLHMRRPIAAASSSLHHTSGHDTTFLPRHPTTTTSMTTRWRSTCCLLGLVIMLGVLVGGMMEGRKKEQQVVDIDVYLKQWQVETSSTQTKYDDVDDVQFEQENERARRASTDDDDPVEMSIQLMTRKGHRHRMSEMIGGPFLGPKQARAALLKAPNFDTRHDNHGEERDYDVNPIRIRHPGLKSPLTTQCLYPIPCTSSCTSQHCDTASETFTMENTRRDLRLDQQHTSLSYLDIDTKIIQPQVHGSTQLTSLIPVPYFSWNDFGMMTPIHRERKPGLAVAYVSNCLFAKRNNMIRSLDVLIGRGKVHSLGKCESTTTEEAVSRAHAGTGWMASWWNNNVRVSPVQYNTRPPTKSKVERLQEYKFSFAFENSEATDYVSEKFFQGLVTGAVPVVIGAPNIKFFAPDTGPFPYQSSAIIDTADYNIPKLAELLMALDNHDEAWNQMVEWKIKGVSDDFFALMDYTSSWTPCRVCVLAADFRRAALGPNVAETRALKQFGSGEFALYVRSRGALFYTKLTFPSRPNMRELITMVLKHVEYTPLRLGPENLDVRHRPRRVYGFFTGQHRVVVLVDEDLAVISSGTELTAVFV